MQCRECRQMHIDLIFWKRRSRAFQWCKLHQNRTIIKEVTSQNVHSNAMSWVSKDALDFLYWLILYTAMQCRECRQMHIDLIFWKRRSRAFQWCKLHQNRTIIKEVTSQNVHSNAMSWVSKDALDFLCWLILYTAMQYRECRQMHIDLIFWKRRSRAFQWCKLHQNRTIIKEVTSQNVHSNAMSWVSKDALDFLYWLILYTAMQCRECRQMHIDLIFWKRRSRTFQWCKLHQNRTIIKEVTSQNVHSNAMSWVLKDALDFLYWLILYTAMQCRECRQMHIDLIFWKRRSRAFQWCKLHQNRTIIKEVTSQNVHSSAMLWVSKDALDFLCWLILHIAMQCRECRNIKDSIQ